MSTLPGTPGWSSDYPAKPVETLIEEGDLCGSCGAWLPGGADPEIRALHLCEPEPEEGVGLADTQTGQGVL